MKTGVVILGHGSRAAVDEANQVLIDLARVVKEKINFEFFATAFMNPKSQRPNLEKAVAGLVQDGVKKIIIAPIFLANGVHMQKDIPEEITRLREKYQVEIKIATHLGTDARIAEIIVEKIKEVV
jgi:sirohydrochlorin ferrochelatase